MARQLLEGLIIGIDHVAVCVPDMDAGAGLWTELLGLPLAHREDVGSQKTTAAFVDDPADASATKTAKAFAKSNRGIARINRTENYLKKQGTD